MNVANLQLEGLMMDGYEVLGAGVVAHLPGLLGRAMVEDPGIVGADGHDGQIHRF